MEAPQITLLALWALNLGVDLAQHGKPSGNHNIFNTLIAMAIVGAVLWWGGFWA